jgi:hypothetical protein
MKTHYANRIPGHNRMPICSRQTAIAVLVPILLGPFCIAQTRCQPGEAVALSRADASKTIYISDFVLQPGNFKQDKGGITGKGYLVPAPPKSFLRRKHQDPATATSNFVDLMSDSLIEDLQKAGFQARRLSSTENKPSEGLLLSGVFTELNEGNQMRRALLGFGTGKAKMQLSVTVADLSCSGKSLYETETEKSNGKGPGAAVALNPYAGAAGFVVKFGMTKNAPEKMVKQTASKITTELTKQLEGDPSVAADQHANNR